MRENQVFAAGVQVKTRPEFLHRHHRAFDVPAGTTRPDRCLPRGFAGLWSLPESEVAGAVLPVFGKFRYAEIVRTVVGAISEAFLDQFGDEVGHFRDVFGGAHQNWWLNA